MSTSDATSQTEQFRMNQVIQAWPAALRKVQAAHYVGVSERAFDRLIASGEIEGRRQGKRTIVYLRAELDEYLEGLPKGKGAPPQLHGGC